MSHANERQVYLTALCRTVPYTVVEAVLDNPSEFSVCSSIVVGTVLNADLVGFTALCERLAAAGPGGLGTLTKALNDLFTRLLDETLFPYEGYVMQFGGDSITAIFMGEDHALRAAAAALDAQKIMTGLPFVDVEENGRPLLMRVGLAQGDIALPIVGDLMQRAVVCGGPTSHRAVALQQRAAPGTVLVDNFVAASLAKRAHIAKSEPDCGTLMTLLEHPVRQPIAQLGERIKERVEEKIALLEPFVAPPLAARLRSTPMGWRIDGELRNVVVLFAEIDGLEEGVTPEVALDLSRSLLRAYRKYGGLCVNISIVPGGQRLMVLFGLHMPQSNDAERSLLAALEATARVKGYLAAANANQISLRTGIHAGQVYFGAFGSDYRHDVTVIGNTVNVGARVAEAAAPFEVLASQAVYENIASEFQHSPRPSVRLKGVAQPLAVKAIHSPSEGIAHYLQTRARRRLLAGRDSETARLRQVANTAWKGDGQVLGLCGPDGTGKSALLSFVVDDWVQRGGLGMLGRCRFATKTEPLAPVISMFNGFLGLTRGGSDVERRNRIRQGLEPFRLTNGAPELVALLQPVRRPDGAHEALIDLADSHARERVLGSIIEFLDRRVEQEHVLYVVEDLHYGDSLTQELAARTTGLGRHRPFFFVATYMPDAPVGAFRRSLDHEVVLENLTAPQAEALLMHELNASAVDPAVLAFVLRRTSGNPAHLIDVTRFLRDRELLQVRGGLVVAPPGGLALLDDVVPKTAANAALAQMDGLGEVEKRIVRMASAIGLNFSRDLLESVSGAELDPKLIGWAMDSLEGRRVIGPDAGPRGYAFRDDVMRAAAYRTMPEGKRREIHQRIANALEARTDLDLSRDAATLAVHRERAGQWKEAARWYEISAQVSLKSALNDEARHFHARWEACVSKLPDEERPSPEDTAQMALLKLAALGRRRLPAQTLGQGRHVATHHAHALGSQAKLIVHFWLGCALAWMGQTVRARDRLKKVWENAEDGAMRCDAAVEMARTYALATDRVAAGRWLNRAAQLTVHDGLRASLIRLLQAGLETEAEKLEEARLACLDIQRSTRKEGLLHIAAIAQNRAACCDLYARNFERARAGFEAALQIDRSLGNWSLFASELTHLGQAFLWDERYTDARHVLEKALRFARDADDPIAVAEASVHLGAAVALSADPEEGLTLLEQGSTLATRVGHREAALAATIHLLHIALVRNDVVAAQRHAATCSEEAREHKTPLLRFASDTLLEQLAVGRDIPDTTR
jgi:class 3 adenylate cyclase/tetratricopeptide (TPR) repeat protein